MRSHTALNNYTKQFNHSAFYTAYLKPVNGYENV